MSISTPSPERRRVEPNDAPMAWGLLRVFEDAIGAPSRRLAAAPTPSTRRRAIDAADATSHKAAAPVVMLASRVTIAKFASNTSRRVAGQWGGAGGACCEDHFAFCGELLGLRESACFSRV